MTGTNTGDQDLSALATTSAVATGERLINAAEITKLGNQSGTNTGDQDLTGLAHTNRTDLDLVSGTNTGDQTPTSLGLVIGADVQAYNSNITIQGNTFNGVSQLVQTDGTGKLPAIDGSQLTNLPSSGGKFIDGTNPLDAVYTDGNVGVGVVAPTEKLDVDGNILASGTISATNLSGTNTGDNATNSQYSGLEARLGALETTMAKLFKPIISGSIAANGTIVSGTGFTVSITSVGQYQISYSTITGYSELRMIINVNGGSGGDNLMNSEVSTTSALVRVYDTPGMSYQNDPFTFTIEGR